MHGLPIATLNNVQQTRIPEARQAKSIMTENWYAQDFEPRPPRKNSFLWLWILLACFVCLSVIVFVGARWVRSQVPAGKTLEQWLAETTTPDTSDVVPFHISGITERNLLAYEAYSSGPLHPGSVSNEELAQIRTLMNDLEKIFQADDDVAFRSTMDWAEFKSRVSSSSSMSAIGRSDFRTGFDDWFDEYCPFGMDVQRIQVRAALHHPSDNTLIVYTWIHNSAYPERAAWYLRQSGDSLRIVDYENLDSAVLHSDEAARLYSSAFTGILWDNFLETHQLTRPESDSDAETEAFRAEIRRLGKLRFPQAVAHWAYFNLARDAITISEYDLSMELLNKAEEIGPLPGIHWQRAYISFRTHDYEQARASLRAYENALGPGPECYQLAAEIADALGTQDEACTARIHLLAIDPDTSSVPWSFHHTIPSARSADFAEAVRNNGADPVTAQKIASLLIDRDRMDLAEGLLPIAESTSSVSPELCALRAKLALENGDHEAYVRQLQEACRLASVENPKRAMWIYEVASELLSMGRAAEAIRQSPDPGVTFYDLAIDETEILLNSRQLQEMSEALQASTTIDGKAAESWLRLWQRLAPITVAMKCHNDSAAWESLSPMFAETQASPDDKMVVELLDELDMRWIVEEWLVQAAIRSGHTQDVLQLLEDSEPINSVLWTADLEDSVEAFRSASEWLRQNEPSRCEKIFCDARIAELTGEADIAEQKFRTFLQHPESPESDFQYEAEYWLSRTLSRRDNLAQAIDGLSDEFLLNSLTRELIRANRLNDAASLLSTLKARGITADQSIEIETSLLHAQRDWPGLCKVYDEWLAGLNNSEEASPGNQYTANTMVSRFLDALLMSQQYEKTQQLLTKCSPSMVNTFQLRIAVAQNDIDAAEALYNTSDHEDGWTQPSFSRVGPMITGLWTDKWREFRDRHPVRLTDLTESQTSSVVILMKQAIVPTTRSLLETLKDEPQFNGVEDITDSIRQLEQAQQLKQQSSRQISPKDVKDAASKPVSTRSVFRVRIGDQTLRLVFGPDQHHRPDGSTTLDMDAMLIDDVVTSESLRDAVNNHHGWISVCIEGGRGLDEYQIMARLAGRVSASLINNNTVAIATNYTIAPVTPSTTTALTNGDLYDLPGAEDGWSDTADPLVSELRIRADARLRELRKRISMLPDAADLRKIRLLVSLPGAWGRDALMFETPLVSFTTPAFPTSFVVNLPESPMIPPAFQNEHVEISAWNILDWSEGD